MAPVTESSTKAEYDFIIIGGGTAGLVVATRLSEDPKIQVLVLEAGEDQSQNPKVFIPGFYGAAFGSEADWAFEGVPQEHLNGRTIPHPQGKMLGGSSALNAMAFIPPSAATIDAWGELGNASWNWKTLSPYYKKHHTTKVPDEETIRHLGLEWINENVRGTFGPVQVSFKGSIGDPLCKAWIDTFDTLGHKIQKDPFAGKGVGGYTNPTTVDAISKTRSSSASSYLALAKGRTNLQVITGANVDQILWETTGGDVTATGVSATVKGTQVTFRARKEVILAAGAFQSPKILELSGIGNKNLLASHGIEVVVENPNVGENLQDHLMTAISFEVKDGIKTSDALIRQELEYIQSGMKKYMEEQAGPFAVSGGCGSFAYMPTPDFGMNHGAKIESDLLREHESIRNAGQQQQLVKSLLENPNEGTGCLFLYPAQATVFPDPTTPNGKQAPQSGSFISLGAVQTHSFARGSVHISSADPKEAPEIDSKYMSDSLDLEFLARHLLFLETLSKTEPLASFLKPNGRRNHPSAFIATLEAAKEYVKATAGPGYHYCGTCAMMPRDKGGVVDEKLRVFGTRNLRVVDASIFPIIPRANIQSSVYAVAERAGDLIKHDFA